TDSSASIAKNLGARVVYLSSSLRACPSAGRFMGSRVATGEFILFLDADTLIFGDFLPAAIEYFVSDKTLGGVNGRIDDLSEAGTPLVNIEERSDDVMNVKWLRGPACFYRRDALLDVGSFDPALAVEEEAELGLRLIQNGWRLAVIPHPMACHTRCYHGQSVESVFSTFRRDIKSQRVGEITKTISHAFRAGNGLAFCWLRLKTTILFLAWIFLMSVAIMLPTSLQPGSVTIGIAVAGLFLIFAKKRDLGKTLLFIPSKILNLVDVIAGLHKIDFNPTRPESLKK
ncbi:MAG: glycosyltransferase, partial [Pyrinomonadaceae bacterium]